MPWRPSELLTVGRTSAETKVVAGDILPAPKTRRLTAARVAQTPWRRWGPYLSERQWGTVGRTTATRATRGTTSPRPGAIEGLPLGRRRAGRHLGRPPAVVFRRRFVERQGSDPQGAPVRPDQQRGQPRRGREGVYVLSRFDAHALVHEVPLQVSPGRVSLLRPGLHQPPPRTPGVRVRAARHRRVRLRSLLRRLRGVREGVARRHPGRDHDQQPRAGTRIAARPADDLVPQPLVLGRGGPAARAAADRRRRRGGGLAPGSGRAPHPRRGRADMALHRERHQPRAPRRRAEPQPLRQGRHQRLHRARRDATR